MPSTEDRVGAEIRVAAQELYDETDRSIATLPPDLLDALSHVGAAVRMKIVRRARMERQAFYAHDMAVPVSRWSLLKDELLEVVDASLIAYSKQPGFRLFGSAETTSLANLTPDASHLRDALGKFVERSVEEERTSPPLCSYPRFRVQDTFPATDPRSAIALTFIMASRDLTTKARSASSSAEVRHEQEQFIGHAMFGAIVEAMDAFEQADDDSARCFEGVPGAERELGVARRETDPTASGTLRKLLQNVRDKAAFHWDRGRIQRAVRELQDDSFFLYEGSENVDNTAVPFLLALAGKLREGFGMQRPEIYPRIVQLADALRILGDTLYVYMATKKCDHGKPS